jgi:hypothetical protein
MITGSPGLSTTRISFLSLFINTNGTPEEKSYRLAAKKCTDPSNSSEDAQYQLVNDQRDQSGVSRDATRIENSKEMFSSGNKSNPCKLS